jgi:toxin ParE1/3/4
MTHLVVTADTEQDVDAIITYLEHEAGPQVAGRYGQRFRAAFTRIVNFPEAGARRSILGPEAPVSIIYPYVVIYDYDRDNDVATLLRILHGKRNITEDLLRR